MPKPAKGQPLLRLSVDLGAEKPVYFQIYGSIRRAILSREIAPGSFLPSTRNLALDLGVSRNTVSLAYDNLSADGLVVSTTGRGTQIAADVDIGELLYPGQSELSVATGAVAEASPKDTPGRRPLEVGVPDLALFPLRDWRRALKETQTLSGKATAFGYAAPQGVPQLRQALAQYLRISRGVIASPDQIIITTGIAQSLHILAGGLGWAGSSVGVENPGFIPAREALKASGARIVPIPYTDINTGAAFSGQETKRLKAVYLTPSHQFPLGGYMSLDSRRAAIAWALENDALLIEDDYDSEFRYGAPPLPSLQGLDGGKSVIYLGSFSKILAPGLRVGYMVVPKKAVPAINSYHEAINAFVDPATQHALAWLIEQEILGVYIQRARKKYAERMYHLIDKLKQSKLPLTVAPSQTGLHLCAFLPEHTDDLVIEREARKIGVGVAALSKYYACAEKRKGLLIGFASTPRADMGDAITKLRHAISTAMAGAPEF